MTDPAPDTRTFKEILDEATTNRLLDIETVRGSDVLGVFGPLYRSMEERVRLAVSRIGSGTAGAPPRRKSLVVVLHTPGGSIDTAERIVNVTRHFYPDEVAFVIPDRAMSAGTILAMSGNSLWMDYYSLLGPVDPQVPVQKPDGEYYVPALGYLDFWDRAVGLAEQGKLTQAHAIKLQELDVAELRLFELERDRSIALIQEWLVRYKFRDWSTTETRGEQVTDQKKSEAAEHIATQLGRLDVWGSHSRGINRDQLQKLNIKIDRLEDDAQFYDSCRAYFEHMVERGIPETGFVHTRAFI
ncbi:MAG: serine dehydrogenasease [Planctomycetota bacterium]